ncbi:hypothetical protein [Caballeronia catudaia]|uniref:hypothetical protein n=1 Tax=Caballeronia catudaia TaxID=1777136 RepID=UPI001359C803|nr:hypothetical protein [Caballeronia catudaia]
MKTEGLHASIIGKMCGENAQGMSKLLTVERLPFIRGNGLPGTAQRGKITLF